MSKYGTKLVAVDRVNLWRVLERKAQRMEQRARRVARLAHYERVLGPFTVEQARVARRCNA